MEAIDFSNPMILSVVVFFAVASLIGAVIFVIRDFSATSTEDRLDILTGRKVRDDDKTEKITKEELIRESVNGLSGIFSGLTSRLEKMRWLFEQADSPIKADAFLGLTVGFGVLGFVGAVAGNAPVPLYPVAALMAGSLPLCWLLRRRRSRFKKFAKQLPDSLELISRALRSGHSLASGMHVVVEEMPPPLSTEFAMAYEEQNLGVPLEDALKAMLKRMPNMDLKFFVTAVVIQRQAGGDMAEILDKISYVIRERFKIMGQVQALTGEGRISGVVLMILPIALFFAVYYLNPDYIMLLFTEELGRQMIAYAAVLQVLGAITIKKIVAIKI